MEHILILNGYLRLHLVKIKQISFRFFLPWFASFLGKKVEYLAKFLETAFFIIIFLFSNFGLFFKTLLKCK